MTVSTVRITDIMSLYSKNDPLRIGRKIRSLRTERGLTQRELAQDSVSRNMLSMIESGAATPSLDTLFHFADKLSVPVGAFFAEGYEEMLYSKREAVENVKFLLIEGRYAEAAQICEPFAEDDGEMRLYLSLCRMESGLDCVYRYSLASADSHLEYAAEKSMGIPFAEDYISSTCDFIRRLIGAVTSDTVPEVLISMERYERSAVPASVICYLVAYKAVIDADFELASAIARSGILGNFHSLHIRGAVLMKTGDPVGATRLFDLALTSDDGGFYSRYRLICDLEACHRDTGNFEAAYSLSTSRMEMLGMFTK